VFLSYLPEAGQYSCFFVFLKLVVGFSQQNVAYFIAYIGIMSCLAQSAVLALLIKFFGKKESIIVGLVFQVIQLALYGISTHSWVIWVAGLLAAMSSITYPAISAFISNHSSAESQGVAQGMITGIRGLCNGFGPALYGFIFWLFHVNLNESNSQSKPDSPINSRLLPGPPFLIGSIFALSALIIMWVMPQKTLFQSLKYENTSGQGKPNFSYEHESLIDSSDINNQDNINLLSPVLIPYNNQENNVNTQEHTSSLIASRNIANKHVI